MSKINLEAPFQSFRGKICKHSKIIFLQALENHLCSTRANAVHQPDLQSAHESVQCRGTGAPSKVQNRTDQRKHRFGRRYAESSVRDRFCRSEQVQELARLCHRNGVRKVGVNPMSNH